MCTIGGLPGGSDGKESACQCRKHKRWRFNPWVRKIPWRREWQPTPVFLPGKSHGQRSLVGYSPWGCKELDRTEWLLTLTNQLGTVMESVGVSFSLLMCYNELNWGSRSSGSWLVCHIGHIWFESIYVMSSGCVTLLKVTPCPFH